MIASALVLAACSGPAPQDAPRPEGPTGETGGPPPADVSCDVQESNALRVACEVVLEQAAPAELTLEPEDGSEAPRTFPSAGAATEHTLVGWDLAGEQRYTWTVSSSGAPLASGTVETGRSPVGLSLATTAVREGPTSIDRLLLPYSCGGDAYLVVADGQGIVRWYGGGFPSFVVNGMNLSDRGSVLAVTGRNRVLEVAWDGSLLIDLQGTDGTFDQPVHHDVVAAHGQTLVLTARSEALDDGRSYVMDGVYEVDASGVRGEWNVGEVLDPVGLDEPAGAYWISAFPGSIDFGHANALEVDERGVWLVSFKHLDTVLAIRDGEVLWSLAGGSRAPEPGTLALSSSVGIDPSFEYQHNVHWTDAGTLMLVDNGRGDSDWTRILEIAVDEQAQTADVIGEWELTGARCPIQSSGYKLDDGSVVAACTANRHIYEFDPDGTLRREVALTSCGGIGTLSTALLRAIPVDI